jgi:hypothetical protein
MHGSFHSGSESAVKFFAIYAFSCGYICFERRRKNTEEIVSVL